jgi:hypothetical protein
MTLTAQVKCVGERRSVCMFFVWKTEDTHNLEILYVDGGRH